MTSLLVTVETPGGSLDLAIPAHLTIEDLLETMAQGMASLGDLREWTLCERGGTPIDPSQTLEAAGVLDGARLSLVPIGADQPSDRTPTERSVRVAVGDRARRVVPERTPTAERISTALNALVGRHRPPEARGPLDRMRQAWAWTEHQRRLDWLITRPRLRRGIFIGVAGHRSDEVAERLADTLDRVRTERVVLVDGGVGGSISRRLRETGAGLEAIEAILRRRNVTSIERDLVFGRTNLGTLAVPVDPSAPLADAEIMRRLCESLPAHAGLVVIDCGPHDRLNAALIERCDQLVSSTMGSTECFAVQTIAAVWGDELGTIGDAYASHPISTDPSSVAELAVVVAAGWAEIGAATPVPLGL